jgi:hypothetical protein
MAGVVEGVEWVMKQHQRKDGAKSLANMSLGGGRSVALDKSVEKVRKLTN